MMLEIVISDLFEIPYFVHKITYNAKVLPNQPQRICD